MIVDARAYPMLGEYLTTIAEIADTYPERAAEMSGQLMEAVRRNHGEEADVERWTLAIKGICLVRAAEQMLESEGDLNG